MKWMNRASASATHSSSLVAGVIASMLGIASALSFVASTVVDSVSHSHTAGPPEHATER